MTTVDADQTIENVLRRDRVVVLSGLLGIAALAWAYMAHLAVVMHEMDLSMAMPQMQAWTLLDFALMLLMWAVMMVAMMVPSAAPMILTFSGLNRRRRERERPYVPTAVFVSGYILIWSAFSGAATLVQMGLHSAALLSPMMVSTSPVVGGSLLLAAGIFQWTPLKNMCLYKCRSPMGFLLHDWQEGTGGALRMGVRHGAYCVGCCWTLMLLLFVVGVMNLLWVATIAGFALLEKCIPAGDRVSRMAGVVLVAWGGWMVFGAL